MADWECVRSTSYVYPTAPLTNAQAAGYAAEGLRGRAPSVVASCPTAPISTPAQLGAFFDTQLAAFQRKYTSVPAPSRAARTASTGRTGSTKAKVELAHGIRLDGNYYHYPGSWIGAKPGFMNGGGFPMRFADLDGTPIDV